MRLTALQTVLLIVLIALATMITRFLPFILFPSGKKHPKIVEDLGLMLPPAMMGLLVVYCLKDISFTTGSHGIPELIGIAITAALHLWKKNTLLSIAAGTISYMILVQFIFV